jgi:hypothetical protein
MSYEDLEKARDERALQDAKSTSKRRSRTRIVDHNATNETSNVVQSSTDSARVHGECTGLHIEGHEEYRPPTARMW